MCDSRDGEHDAQCNVCRKTCGLIWALQLNLVIKFLRKPRVDWAATECTANFYSYKTFAKHSEIYRYKKHSGTEPAKRAQCSPNLNLNPTPSVCAEERRSRRNRASDCLSEASSSSTPAGSSTAGCPQRSGGTQTVGSPFFSLGFFGEAKKSESPAAATERHQDSAKNAVIESRRKASTGSARTGRGTRTVRGPGFRSGRFWGQSTNSPSLRPALRVLRFARSEIVIRPQKPGCTPFL